jgi:hypothetical protein
MITVFFTGKKPIELDILPRGSTFNYTVLPAIREKTLMTGPEREPIAINSNFQS